MKKIFYALLLSVFVLSMSVGTADAAWTQGFNTAKKVLQNATSTTMAAFTADVNVVYTLGAGETLNTNDTLVITLGGGAKFAATVPTVTGSTGAMSIVGSAVGQTTANFRVATVALQGHNLVFNTNTDPGIFDLSAANGDVTFQIEATTSVGSLRIFKALTTALANSTNPFSAPSASSRVSVVTATNIADVSAAAGAYKAFTAATNVPTLTFTSLVEAANTAPIGSPVPAGSVIFGITGDFVGMTAPTAVAGITGCSSTGVTGTGVANKYLLSGTTAAYAKNTAAVAPQGAVVASPTFVLDGTTAQAARSFSASVSVLTDATYWTGYTAQAATALYSITRNGSSFVTNSVGSRNTIKITDRSNGMATAGGNITITAYDVNGVTIPFSGTGLKLQNNATTTITGTQLAAFFPTGTPMRYEFSVESSTVVVTNVKSSVDGSFTSTTIFTNTNLGNVGI